MRYTIGSNRFDVGGGTRTIFVVTLDSVNGGSTLRMNLSNPEISVHNSQYADGSRKIAP